MSDLIRVSATGNGAATGNGRKNVADNVDHHPVTRVRSAEAAVTEASWAVAEYLRDLGLRDPERIARESHRMVATAQRDLSGGSSVDEANLAEAAIHRTVKQLDHWLSALAADSRHADEPQRTSHIAGAHLPDLLSRYPEAWKQKRPTGAVSESCRADLVSVVPEQRPRQMGRQTLALLPAFLKRQRSKLAGFLGQKQAGDDERSAAAPTVVLSRASATRVTLAILTMLSTALATGLFCRVIARDGFTVIDFALAVLFAVLFLSVVFSFWTATFGLIVSLRGSRRGSLPPQAFQTPLDLPPTAIVMPIYNEEPREVFANLRAIARSLEATGQCAAFSIFVLSDTTDPDVWLEEERTWAKLVAEVAGPCPVFYRHRPKNESRKAGNIADFCRRWGEHYKYMIVLDADSVMAGETLVELVRRMEGDPLIGILQAPPRPVGRQSLFARMQQFAAHMYGPVFLEGFALWSQCDGNYWGHNAIIRIRPFMEHCELPILPGEGPLSGEILSHDFVEAALMRRAGWKVCIAHDLDQSYEACPTTIVDFAQRDQRWCQGNLQHVRLLLAEGLHPASRLHFGMGAMSYLAAPLWLLFLVLTVIGASHGSQSSALIPPSARIQETAGQPPGGMMLFVITMSLLLLPKVWGVIATSRQSQSSTSRLRVLASVLIESIASMLIAPILMLLHTRFVASALLGTKVKWVAQCRQDSGVSLRTACAVHYPHTLCGLAIGLIAWVWAPGLLLWLSPVLAGLVLAIPLAMSLGSVSIGTSLGRRGLLTIPEEVVPPPILKYQHDALVDAVPQTKTVSDRSDLFAAVIRDPTFYALHVGILRATEGHLPISPEQLQQVEHLLLDGAASKASAPLRRAVLGDGVALEKLHILVRSHVPPSLTALLA
jgi:membrane glycosyltransferase